MRNPLDLLIGAALFVTPVIAPYFWPAVATVLGCVVIILLGV